MPCDARRDPWSRASVAPPRRTRPHPRLRCWPHPRTMISFGRPDLRLVGRRAHDDNTRTSVCAGESCGMRTGSGC
eukprot:349821-Chlamydomonas_euryale.AAC.2